MLMIKVKSYFKMKIAVTFWGTQKYIEFLPQWYERLEKYFIPKSYYLGRFYMLDASKYQELTLMIQTNTYQRYDSYINFLISET